MKNRNTAGLLALFLGGFGVHKFYLNRPVQGILYLALCWTFIPGLFGFIEALRYFFQTDLEFNAIYNEGRPVTATQSTRLTPGQKTLLVILSLIGGFFMFMVLGALSLVIS